MDNAAHKFGWKIFEWGRAAGISRSRVYELMAEGRIESVKLGSSRLIVTHPRDFLAGLASRQAGAA